LKNNYKKLKSRILFQTSIVVLAAGILGYFILDIFVDGIFQNAFYEFFLELLAYFNLEREEAMNIYRAIFMDNKNLFVVLGFVVILLFFMNVAISSLTRYLDEIGVGIENILSDSTEPIDLTSALGPIEIKLNTIKNTLKRQQYEAEESEQKKNDLVVYLAHDLKTPLTSVIAYLSVLDERVDMEAEERRKYTHIAMEKALRLGVLINEFFEITTFNLQDIVLEKGKLNLSMMLEQLADESYAILDEKSLTCTVSTDENLIVDGDPDKLVRVFDNLLRNAIAYSYPGTPIIINAIEKGNMIEITFTNQGNQIPLSKLSSIFEKFYRVDNSRSSQTGGAGLGLAIAKEIVELHQGYIEAVSDELSTRFIVRLPNAEYQQEIVHPKVKNVKGVVSKNSKAIARRK